MLTITILLRKMVILITVTKIISKIIEKKWYYNFDHIRNTSNIGIMNSKNKSINDGEDIE